jgi:hypothetical protein
MTACILAIATLSAAAQNAGEPKPSAPSQALQEKSGPTAGSVPSQALLDRLKAPRLEDRMAALHVIVGKDPALPMLKNARVRMALVDLFQRETNNARGSGLGERMDFERYYDFLSQAVQKIASGYQTPEAWKALVYSNYAAGSPFGEWVAKQPESYSLLLAWVDDKDGTHRRQALEMLGYIGALNPERRPAALQVLRERIASSDTPTQQGALQGLGWCGTQDDIALLHNLPACSSQWDVKILCKQEEAKIGERLRSRTP